MKTELKLKLIATLMGSTLALTLAAPGLAADRSDTSASSRGKSAQTSSRDIRATRLMGAQVRNSQGEDLGKIDDLVVDVNNQRIHYAVLASGGVMGVGGKKFAYPVSLLRTGTDKDELILNVDKERLSRAPGFDDKNAPEWSNRDDRYRAEVDRYYGPTVSVKAMPNEKLARASTLLDKEVTDRQGRDAGKIKDLVVNMGSGKVNYAVLDLNNRWGAGADDKLLPVALTSFTFPAEQGDKIAIKLAPDQVNLAQAGIDEKRWENMDVNDPTFKRNVDSYMRTASSPVPASSTGAAGRQGQDRERREEQRERSETRSGQQQPAD